MQIVIKIDDDAYKDLIQTGENTINLGVLLALREAVKNGTPLPENHGRLIDADAMQKYQIDTFGQRLLVIDTAPTIIDGSDTE